MTTVLIVDDEPDIVWAVRHILHEEGHDVMTADNGLVAIKQAHFRRPDLVVLDINMPGLDGIGVCRELRSDVTLASIPILFLSVRQAIEDRVNGLDVGGDDYLCKPFDLEELKARVRALLRRATTRPESVTDVQSVLEVDALRLDPAARSLQVDGTAISVTPIELTLLTFLMSHAGEVFSSKQLLELVWGYPPPTGEPGLVRWHVKRLRERIEADPAHPVHLRTVARFGYVVGRRLAPDW